eukprot:scaffold7302_cov72-Cyclotella_meneghiniana.AAC.10
MTIKTADFSAKPPEPFSSSLEPSSNLFASLSNQPISLTANDNYSSSNYSVNQYTTSTSNTPSFPVNQNVNITQPSVDHAAIKVTTSCKLGNKRRLIGFVAGLLLIIILSSVLGSIEWPEHQQSSSCIALEPIEIDSSTMTKMKLAVDENNLVVVASGSSEAQVNFYSRVNGEWEYRASFRENSNDLDFNVVLSKDTIILDFAGFKNNINNNIIMYELKSDGSWWKRDDFPIQNLPTYRCCYQPGLSLDGDLACMSL